MTTKRLLRAAALCTVALVTIVSADSRAATNDSRYRARVDAPAGVTPSLTLTGQHAGTTWSLLDQAGASLGQGTLGDGDSQTVSLPGVTAVSLVTSAPVSAWLGAGVGGASGFFPASTGLRAGDAFTLTVPPLGAGDALVVFSFDAADVTITAPDGTPVDANSLPAYGVWEPTGLAAGDTVQVSATGPIAIQVAGVTGFDAVPDRFGNDVGYDFLTATGPLGGVAVLAYEDAVIAALDLDDGSLVAFETVAKGAIWHQGDLAGRRLWLSSNAPVAVWAGDHDGAQDVGHLGDDVALHLGRAGTELRIHTQALGATVFAGTDGTVVHAGAQTIPLSAGASADLAANQALLVTSNHPVLVETRGGTTLQTWGVALRELPPGPATAFDVLPLSNTVAVGEVLPFTIIARDAGGAIDMAYAGTAATSSTDAYAVLPEAFTFGVGDQGQHTFANELRFLTAGVQTLTVKDVASPTKQGAAVVTVTGGGLDAGVSLVSAAPDTIDANGTATATVTVTPLDAFENLLGPGQTVVITASLGTLEGVVADVGDGTYTQVLRAPAVAGTAAIGASVGGVLLEAVATVTFKKDSTPPAPVFASVTAVQETQATMTWTPSASPDLASYEVVASQGGDVFDAAAATSYDVTGLTGCTSYGFRVIPIDAVGNKGVASNEVTFTTVLDGPPPAPGGLTGAAYDTYVIVQWDPATACDHATWSVERSVGGAAFTTVATGLTVPKLVDTGLTNDVEVRYRVTDHDSTGLASAPTAELPLTPTLMDPAPPVQGLVATSKPGGAIALTWDPPADGEALHFTVYRDGVAVGDPAGTSFVDAPPAEGSYDYTITWFDVVDAESQLSAPATGISDATPPSGAIALTPAPPVGLGERIVTLTASEALGEAPVVTWKVGSTSMAPVVLSPKPGDPSVWTGTLSVPAGAPSGTATLAWSGKDVAGNVGTALTGGSFAVDAAPPTAIVTLSRPSPVNAGPLGITLTVSEPLVAPPTLTWAPFLLVGEPVSLDGSGLVWTGEIAIVAGPNDGEATLAFSGTDGAGNVGTVITAGATFVVDTTPPNDPQTLLVLSAPKGAFNLAWGTSSGGGVAKYEVFRSDAPITSLDGLSPIGAVTTNKLTDLPPGTGTWHYAVRAVDAAGNASGFITGSGTSDQEPPGPPTGLAATVGGGQVSLAWVAPSTGATTYRVYRALISYGGSVAGKAPLASGVAAPLSTDTPASDADYYYVITALDAYQNESGPSNEVMVHFDEASPVITVTGVEAGKHYKAAVQPAWTATDFTLQSSTGTVDGQPFVSGASVADEGAHELIVTAKDGSGHTSTKKVSFVLDLTKPVVTVNGVAAGQLYEAAPSATVTATDANLTGKTVTLDGKAYAEGSPITTHGNHTLVATATDKAGNQTVVSVTFEVDLPPGPVPSLAVVVKQDDVILASWAASTEPDIVGYRLVRNGSVLFEGAGLAAGAGAPPSGSERAQLQVIAIDGRGHVGAPRAATVYPLRLALVQAGAVLEDGTTALTRDTFDTVALQAQSEDPQALVVGPLGFTLLDDMDVDWSSHTGTETWSLAAQGDALVDGAILTHQELTDASTAVVSLGQPALAGSTVRLEARFPVAVRWPPGPLLEVLPKQLLRGFEGEISAAVHNHGTARMDIVAAKGGGFTDDVIVTVRTPEGVVLDQAKTSNISGATWVGQDAVAQIAPDGQFTFGPATIVVPVDAPDTVIVEARVVHTWHGYGAPGAIGGPELVQTALVSVVPPPYEVSAVPDKGAYKAGEVVIVSGVATSTVDESPVPDVVVKLVVSRKGFKQTLYAKTDAQGVYAIPFLPTPGMAGVFAVAAAHPGVVNPATDGTFAVHGLLLGPAAFNVSLLAGTTYQATFTLENKGETPITGLSAAVPDLAPDDEVTPAVVTPPPATLAAGKSAKVVVALTATSAALAGKRAFTLSVTSAEESPRTGALSVDVSVPTTPEAKEWPPVLYVSPQWLDLTLVSGKSLVKSVKVTNKGNGAWKGVHLGLPTNGWIKVTTPADIGEVAPGESRTIDLLFLPPPSQPTGVVTDTLWMLSDNHQDIPLNMTLKVTSADKGQVLVKVTNYVYALTAPDTPVPGANVTLQSQAVVTLKLSGTAGPDGTVLFENVPAGPYKYIVQAAGFQTVDSASLGTDSGSVTVEGGKLSLVEVALVESFVDVGWSVTPTTVQDEYDIQVETTFETKVPVPVLNIVPAQQQFSIFPGSSQTGQIEIVNIGLVSAWNVAIGFEQSSYLDLQLASSVIPEIKAQSSVLVPFTIALKTHGSPPPEPCTDYSLTGDVTYLWFCDTAGNWVKMPALPFGISVKSNAAKVSMGPNVITRSTYYNCPGFSNGQSVVPPNVTITNGDSSPVTICDCGRMTTSGIGLPTLSGLVDKLFGEAKKKAGDLLGKVLAKYGVPSWDEVTEAMGEDVYGDDWPAVKDAKAKLDDLAAKAKAAQDLINTALDATCEDQSLADNIGSALTALANEAADAVLNQVLNKYTGGAISFSKAYTKFDKLCVGAGGSSSAEVPKQSHSFGMGTMSASVAKGCGPDKGSCCPVSVGYVDYTVICLPGGGSSSQSGGGGGCTGCGDGGWGGWAGGGTGSSGYCTK